MSTLLQRRLTVTNLAELLSPSASAPSVSIDDEHRTGLARRLRAVPVVEHRRLDAWMVEQAGRPATPFTWSPLTARRILGNSALRRLRREPTTIVNAVREEIADQLLRSVTGYARAGSLGHWLAGVSHPVLGLITAEAVNWATQTLECLGDLDLPWRVASSDAYYDVAAARTTLRGRRDVIVGDDAERTIVRIRGGSPGKSAGSGLRSDLVVEALAHPGGVAPRRYLGIWPDAGLILGVEGSWDDLRAGSRDFVRAAVARRRHELVRAA